MPTYDSTTTVTTTTSSNDGGERRRERRRHFNLSLQWLLLPCHERRTTRAENDDGNKFKVNLFSYLCNLQAKIKFIAYRNHKFHREDIP